ncbi:MAG: hypothetical protein CM1200mP36_09230 [Gammaproteobacteria bacterium]|nr:MAG: hypothetical protein CM1200mP36_09230 [Gammaproteobacteria bacterium]
MCRTFQAVSANMGADNLNFVTYTATGYVGPVGQTSTSGGLAQVGVSDYTRSVNYTPDPCTKSAF